MKKILIGLVVSLITFNSAYAGTCIVGGEIKIQAEGYFNDYSFTAKEQALDATTFGICSAGASVYAKQVLNNQINVEDNNGGLVINATIKYRYLAQNENDISATMTVHRD